MLRNGLFVAGGLMVILAAGPVRAEDAGGQDQPSINVYAFGGGFSPTMHLDTTGTTKFKTGWDVGGGVGYQFNRYVALRGNFLFARDAGQVVNGIDFAGLNGANFDRYVYTGEVQLGYPLAGGVKPYVVLGGGGMTFKDMSAPGSATFTRGVGKAGVGLAFEVPRSNLSLFVQGNGLLYKWNQFGFDRTQFDTTWTGGLSYRFRI